MKVKHLILCGLLTLGINAYAQQATTVISKTETVGEESGSALSTKINRASEKEVIKGWKSVMKNYKGSVKTKKTTITATEVLIDAIDSKPIKVVAEVRMSTVQEHELVVIFMKNGSPISAESDLSAYTAAKVIVSNFANELSKEATEAFLKEQTKLSEGLQKDFDKAEKEQKKAEEALQEAKEEIKKAEA